MCKFITKTVKDGNHTITYLIYVDLSKPACYREDFEYKFNSYIVNIEYND